MKLNYHQATFDLLGLEPVFSESALRVLEEREQICTKRFPASVREWYSLQGAQDVLEQYGGSGPGGDHAVPLGRLGEEYADWYGKTQANFIALGLLVVMQENQGVCNWAAKLDGSEDPPVLVEVDSSSGAASLRSIEWEPCADRFSTFLFTRVWDFGPLLSPSNGTVLCAQSLPLSVSDLEFMMKNFSEAPRTRGWPGKKQYRFFNDVGRVLLWDSDNQTDWRIGAESEQKLLALTKLVWRCGNLASALYGLDERGESILRLLRQTNR